MTESDRITKALFESTGDLIMILNKELQFQSVNPAADKAFKKYFNKSFVGLNLMDISPEMEKSEVYKLLKNALLGEAGNIKQLKSFVADQYYEVSFIPVKEESIVSFVLVIAKDITEITNAVQSLREANKMLLERNDFVETIIENNNAMIVVYDAKQTLLSINKTTETIFGMKRDDVVGKTFLEIMPAAKGSKSEADLIKALNGETINNEPFYSSVSGRYIQNHISPLKDSYGNVYAALAMANDVTDLMSRQKEIEVAHSHLNQKNNELAKANAELEAFNYIASHDLKEPLRKIHSFISRILEKEGNSFSETGKEYFSRIINAADRMQNLIDSLLNYSGLSTEDSGFIKVKLNIIMDEVLRNLSEIIEDKKVTIHVGDLPELNIIYMQFIQLFSNLIENSVKYAKKNEAAVININSEYSENLQITGYAPGNFWKISISDNGIGFEEEYSKKIFDLFTRLHGRKEYSGTGIGLSICKKIVENHKGFINASGIPGEGSTFEIYLPA